MALVKKRRFAKITEAGASGDGGENAGIRDPGPGTQSDYIGEIRNFLNLVIYSIKYFGART